MDDLISRQDAITLPIMPKEYRTHKPIDCDDAYVKGWCDCQSCIGCLPTAEKKGKWKISDLPKGQMKYCSECGFGQYIADMRTYHYCPNCGARMEE